MTKKVILNDNEVVFNEDVSAAQDWRSQDLNSSLEAIFQGTYKSGPSTPLAVVAGAVLSGLLLDTSTLNLTVTVSGGLAVFGFGGGDVSMVNRFRLASSDSTSLVLPVAHVTLHRWDVIEVSAEEITTTETRQVLTSLGPVRRLVNTVVPKFVSSNLKLRVRSGTPDVLDAARLPALQPDQAWLPVAAIRVAPGALTTSGLQILDLRKQFSFCSPPTPTNLNRDGFRSPVAMSSNGQMISAAPNWVHMGQYFSPLGTSVKQNALNRPQINVNVDKPSSLSLQFNRWYYIYAYRPHINCGYSSMVLSSVPPDATDAYTRGRPSGSFELPVPWPATEPSAVAMYMGAVRLYTTGGVFYPLPFRKAGGYTALAYNAEAGYDGANTQGKIHSGTATIISPGATQTRTVNPDGDGLEAVPPHSRLVRVSLILENSDASATPLNYSLRTNTIPHPFILYRVLDVDPDHMADFEVDVPLDSNMSFSLICTGDTPGDEGIWRGFVRGFFEEMP